MAIMTVLTICNAAMGHAVSLLSIGFMLSIYFISILNLERFDDEDAHWLHRYFIRVMTLMAVVTLTQFAIQYVGVEWADVLAKVVPKSFLLSNYNTGNPIYYGSHIYRPNGVLFLEPSFVSLFLGIAIVMALSLRSGWVGVTLMSAALVTTVAGNGFVVVSAGVIVLIGQKRIRARSLVVTAAGIMLIALATPLGHLILDRTTELSDPGTVTSSDQRLKLPYQILIPSFIESPASIVFGQGPGSAADVIAADPHGKGVIAASVPKLLVEYGIIGTIAFLMFILVALQPGLRRYAFSIGLCINYLIVNEGLLQPVIATTTFILLGLTAIPVVGVSVKERKPVSHVISQNDRT